MEVCPISLDDAISLESRDSPTALRVNIFTSDAIQCCRLSCRALLTSNETSMLDFKTRKAAKVAKSFASESSSPFTLQDLKESAEQGCTACCLFECLFRELLASLGCINSKTAVLTWLSFLKFKILLQFGAVQRRVQLFCVIGSATKLEFLRPTKMLTGDTSSDVSMQRAHLMIETCEREHASCRLGREELLPKRLVDLSPIERGENHVRLVEFAENAGVRGTYACLSHCWGQDPMPITTTQTNILENKRSMSLSRLPPTFRDAIIIARKLKLRYIWIDSLCILQDSRSDWESESAKMASVYKNAFITIAATASPDFQGGCFSKSDADLCFHVKQSGVLDTVIAARTEVTGELPELYPLLTRGWVYQERMLSRRYLHCYRNELMLECREQRICECGNHPGRDLYGEQLAAKSKYHNPGQNRLAGSWQKVVMNYSMLRLTKSSDKLPAIFACAQDMGDPNRGRYLAGVWERTLGEDLLWTPRKYSTVSRPTWRAPSWTWASIDTPDGVKFLAGGIGYAAPGATTSLKAFQTQIKESRCDPKDPNSPFDLEPAAAYLQIKCKLINAHIRRMCYTCRKAMTVDHWYKIETDQRFDAAKYQDQNRPPCTFGVDKLQKYDSRFELLQDFKYTETTFEFSTSDEGHPDGCMIAPVSLLKVIEIGGNRSKGTATCFFLLLKAIDGKPGTYVRVGIVSVGFSNEMKLHGWLDDVIAPRSDMASVITIV